MAIALVTTYLSDYRRPLYRLLARRYDVEVLAYGRGERYVPSWFGDLDGQLAAADFPARRLPGLAEALALGRRYDAVIAPFAGGSMLPAAYLGARAWHRPFVLWASVWHQPRSLAHLVSLPVVRHIYRDSGAVLAYGEHVRRFVAGIRGHDDDVFVAPQTVEPELFRRPVADAEVRSFRAAHGLGDGPLVLYCGRLVPEKGVATLAAAWPQVSEPATLAAAWAQVSEPTTLAAASPRVSEPATLVLVGDGPLRAAFAGMAGARAIGPLPRAQLPAAYAAARFAVLPSIPTPRFREPWGLVCSEAAEQGRPMVASSAVGAVAGGLVVDGVTGRVVAPGDPAALARAIDELLADPARCERLGAAARAAVAPYTYEAMADAVGRALASGGVRLSGLQDDDLRARRRLDV
ncbi:MAG: glycosyltransferase family 4 protein [Solirubrobacterales bacterium]|nr:glycosyltransferase family 4 protein [Solirubrobacterales bacterium]